MYGMPDWSSPQTIHPTQNVAYTAGTKSTMATYTATADCYVSAQFDTSNNTGTGSLWLTVNGQTKIYKGSTLNVFAEVIQLNQGEVLAIQFLPNTDTYVNTGRVSFYVHPIKLKPAVAPPATEAGAITFVSTHSNTGTTFEKVGKSVNLSLYITRATGYNASDPLVINSIGTISTTALRPRVRIVAPIIYNIGTTTISYGTLTIQPDGAITMTGGGADAGTNSQMVANVSWFTA
jgi:hypothetical protein